MPSIRVFNKNKLNSFENIEYEFGDETLESFIKRYDQNALSAYYRVAVGDYLFNKWTASLDACLIYGDSISIYRYKISLTFVHKGVKHEIKFEIDKTIEMLKNLIENILDVYMDEVVLKVGIRLLSDKTKQLWFYDISSNSLIEFESGRFIQRKVNLNVHFGEKSTDIKINTDKNLKNLKNLLEGAYGVCFQKVSFRFGKTLLTAEKMSKLLKEVGIIEDTTIHLENFKFYYIHNG